MYRPGSNYRATERLRKKREEETAAHYDAWLARLNDALRGAVIKKVEDSGDTLTITYSYASGRSALDRREGRIVIGGTDFGPSIDNPESEW